MTEAAASRAAHAAGVSPGVRYAGRQRAGDRDLLDGRTLTSEDIQRLKITRIAPPDQACASRDTEALPGAGACLSGCFRWCATTHPARIAQRARAPSAGLRQDGGTTGTGGRPDRYRVRPQRHARRQFAPRRRGLWLIDWEDAGFNSPLFEQHQVDSP